MTDATDAPLRMEAKDFRRGAKDLGGIGATHSASLCSARKAQLEMVGLVVLVIIVVIAMLVFFVYKANSPKSDARENFINAEIANNFIFVMAKTSVPSCHDLTLSELISDCASPYRRIICDNDTLSCAVANRTVEEMVNKTLVDWGVNFNLTISGTNITFSSPSCRPPSVAGFEIIPLYPGNIEVMLKVCEK